MDRESIKGIVHKTNIGYNEFQIEEFVLNTQYTDNRKLRQCLIELETREAKLDEFKLNLIEKEAEIALKQEEIDSVDGPQKTIYEVEMKRLKAAERATHQHIDNISKEIDTIYKHTEKYLTLYELETPEKVNEFINDPELERQYWVTRMGVQAAIDMLTHGRIQAGNLSNLITMNNRDRTEAIAGAISFTKKMEGGLLQLQDVIDRNIEYKQTLPDVESKLIDFNKLLK